MPFRPGGLEDILVDDSNQKSFLNDKGLRTIPPGFVRGLRLPKDSAEDDQVFSLEVESSSEQCMVRMNSFVKTLSITVMLGR